MPVAVLMLKQGLGRLIRTRDATAASSPSSTAGSLQQAVRPALPREPAARPASSTTIDEVARFMAEGD